MAKRIGSKMAMVRWMVSNGPRARIDVAEAVGPNGSLMYGYATVKRAIKAGIVKLAPPLPGRHGMTLVMS
jgi:hypothetical protein